jgi:hypothetical protein
MQELLINLMWNNYLLQKIKAFERELAETVNIISGLPTEGYSLSCLDRR